MNNFSNNFPSNFFDSSVTTQKRITAQKPYSKADYFTFFTYRKFSIYLSTFCIYLNISATFITYLSMLAFIASIAICFIVPINQSLILVPLLWHLGYFLDVVDGEIARLTKSTSSNGALLDKYIFLLCVLSFYNFLILIFPDKHLYTYFIILLLLTTDIFFNIEDFLTQPKVNSESTKLKAVILFFLKLPLIKPGVLLLIPVLYFYNIFLLKILIFIYLFINACWSLLKLYKLTQKI
jgi:phosphatidylglycerophosphate synthase